MIRGNGFMNNSVSGSPQDLSMTTRLQPLGDDPTLVSAIRNFGDECRAAFPVLHVQLKIWGILA